MPKTRASTWVWDTISNALSRYENRPGGVLKYGLLWLLSLVSISVAASGGIYQKPADFINEVFAGDAPKVSILWLTGKLRDDIKGILGHKPATLRTRYWKRHLRSAWILEETGKTKPITVGVVINRGHIEKIKVLVFRESRGWEVRHAFFTDQFLNATLTSEGKLDRKIDGVTGATLSVRALRKMAQLALYLDRQSGKP